MSIEYKTQRRPITAEDVADNDALSARTYARLADNANNLMAYCARQMLAMQFWPADLQGQSTTLTYAAQWPRVRWPHGLSQVRFVIGWRNSGAPGTIYARVFARQGASNVLIPATTENSTEVSTVSSAHLFTAGSIAAVTRWTTEPTVIHLVLALRVSVATVAAAVTTFKAWADL